MSYDDMKREYGEPHAVMMSSGAVLLAEMTDELPARLVVLLEGAVPNRPLYHEAGVDIGDGETAFEWAEVWADGDGEVAGYQMTPRAMACMDEMCRRMAEREELRTRKDEVSR